MCFELSPVQNFVIWYGVNHEGNLQTANSFDLVLQPARAKQGDMDQSILYIPYFS